MCLQLPELVDRDSVFAYKVVYKSENSSYLPIFQSAYKEFWDLDYPKSFHALMSLRECVELLNEIYNEGEWLCRYTYDLHIVAVELSGSIYGEYRKDYLECKEYYRRVGYKARPVFAHGCQKKESQVAGTSQTILFEIPHSVKNGKVVLDV